MADEEPTVPVDIVIGIPSRDEGETIGHVTRQVDQGLARLPGNRRSVIVNVDNSSGDATRSAFLAVPTRHPKESQRPDRSGTGKGANVLTVLRMAEERGARVVALFDADVHSMSADWVSRLVGPVLRGAADFVSPRYATSQGGPLRTLICRPIVDGLFLAPVEQPTGGEVAFTGTLAGAFLAAQRPEPSAAVARYGIDIFLTTQAVRERARLVCADLGVKAHRRRPWHTIAPIAQDVAEAAFEQLHRHRDGLRRQRPVSVSAEPGDGPEAPIMRTAGAVHHDVSDEERTALHEHFRAGLPCFASLYRRAVEPALLRELCGPACAGITAGQWPRILFPLIRYALDRPGSFAECAAALMPMFEGRMAAYADELTGPAPDTAQNFASYRHDRLQVLAA